MALTNAQLLAIKEAINASVDPAVVAARNAKEHGTIAEHFNAVPQSGALKVWKPVVTVTELTAAVVWTAYIGRSLQEQGGYMAMTQSGFIDATDPQVRSGMASVFGGAAQPSVVNILAVARRDGTRLETLAGLSVNSGVSPNNALVSQLFGYRLSNQEVADAMEAV